jgi:F-type H+-transporting ATPase subunit alpha
VEEEVVILYAVTRKYLKDVNVEKALEFESQLLAYMEGNASDVLDEIRESGDLSPELEKRLASHMDEFKKQAIL